MFPEPQQRTYKHSSAGMQDAFLTMSTLPPGNGVPIRNPSSSCLPLSIGTEDWPVNV